MTFHEDLMAMASQHIPCHLGRAHPEHIYPGVAYPDTSKTPVWYCDGEWPKGAWDKFGDSVRELGRAYRRALEPPLAWLLDRLSRLSR